MVFQTGAAFASAVFGTVAFAYGSLLRYVAGERWLTWTVPSGSRRA
jgi:hypothetical protein